MATRRGFIAGLAALTLPAPGWADVGNPAFLAAGREGADYVLHGLTTAGETTFRVALPGRGHAAAAHPQRPVAVAFARRPGVFALVLDCRNGAVLAHLTPPEGRQFNGHGVFSADGAVLYTSEVVAETSQGRIGLWQSDGFRRIGEWDSGGIGPHDIKRLADGRLVVANGGIATDPTDRSKLNLDSMRPNLSLLSQAGRIDEQMELTPDLSQNSIRHLALGRDGTIAFAMQWEGDVAEAVPLLGLWRPGGRAQLCPPRPEDAFRMQGYAGSVAMTGDGTIALTSPRGGVVMLHDRAGQHVATHARADISGVAAVGGAAGGRFLASDGGGALWSCARGGLDPIRIGGPQWDNHLVNV